MYFEATKRILSLSLKTIAKAKKLTNEQALKQVQRYLRTMSNEWFNGEEPQIAYDDPLCRWAYIYAHVPVNANLCETVLQTCSQARSGFRIMLDAEELSVMVFGGGPGTELLGLAKYYMKNAVTGVQTDVDFQLIDRVAAWSENLNSIREEIYQIYAEKFGPKKKWPAQFHTMAYPLDFSDIEQFGNLPTLFKKKLFIFSFIVSEVFDLDILRPIMSAMVEGCPKGAYFLFIDRADDTTSEKIDTLITDLGLKDLGDAKLKSNMDGDEQKSVLSEFSAQIGRDPRLTWDARWKLARKPTSA